MDNNTKDSKKSPIHKFQLLVIGIRIYLENLIQNNINCHTNKGRELDFLAIAFLSKKFLICNHFGISKWVVQ
jgi:hypothetical protein